MSLDKIFFERETNITAKVICDSISEDGIRITTLEVEYPRFIHCFDGETEVLAKVGKDFPEFMSFEKAFELEAEIGQYDENTGKISFTQPLERIVNDGVHSMVVFEKDKLSLCVTDEHRMLVEKRTTGNTWHKEVWKAKEMLGDFKQCRILQSGQFVDGQVWSKEEIALSVWFASDGTVSGNKTVFHFKKERKVESVTSLLEALSIDYVIKRYKESTVIKFSTPSWVSDCYTTDGSKKLPNDALFMNQETYEFVKNAILDSDGCRSNKEFNSTSLVYAEQVQMLAHLHNDSMNLKYYGKDEKRLYKSSYKDANYVSLRRDKDAFDEVSYRGKVYCVTVPTSFVMVRRKGVVHISGNCEFMTHRELSKNSSSSRAVPIDKMLSNTRNNMAVPLYWGKSKSGMQADGEVSKFDEVKGVLNWEKSFNYIEQRILDMKDLGLHKQIPNRLSEPFQMMKVVVTATNWDNFFNLRVHRDAQPEICMLAYKMYQVINDSRPYKLKAGEWHLPYVEIGHWGDEVKYYITDISWDDDQSYGMKYEKYLTLEDAIKISASCCAQVSYRNTDMSLEKADKIFDMLVKADVLHASCFEHLATPVKKKIDELGTVRVNCGEKESWECGITHRNRQGELCSGNLRGWISYRHLLPNNTCWKYDHEERMKLFN